MTIALIATATPPVRRSAASPSSSSALLVQQGEVSEAEGDELAALKRYADALTLDATNDKAYLRLGSLRAKRNELLEAEGVFDVGISRVPGAVDLYLGRARVRRLRGRGAEASDDLRRASVLEGPTSSPRELSIAREAIALARAQNMQATELAAWRRVLAIAHARGDDALAKEASVQARALGVFVGDVDPVLGGRRLGDPLRKSLASVARRGG